MKIMFAIDRMSGFGGAQRVIANLANKVFLDGNEVSLLLTGDSGESVYPLENGIKILHTPKQSNRFSKYTQLRKAILREKPDAIVSFLTMVNVLILMVTVATGIPVIISERNDPDYCSKSEKRLAKGTYRLAASVVVQTEAIKNKLRKYYKKEIYVIPNPVVIGESNKENYERNYAISAVGRLNPQKNYFLMLDAMKKFHEKHDKYVLHIYGDGALKGELIEYTKNLMLQDHVVFHGNDPDVKEKIKDTDFFVMSSDFEGMPNSLAEAMSIGLPVISTDCDGGGASYLITDGVDGRLVDKGNSTMLYQAMCEYAEDPCKAKQMGEKAKELRKRLSISTVNGLWLGVIHDVLHR